MEGITKWTDYRLADETDRLEGRDLQIGGALLVVDEAKEDPDQISPLSLGQLHRGDGSDDLGGDITGFRGRGVERHERILLDLSLCIVVETQPPVGVLLLPRIFL